ncbi:MAG: mechanosensitive ion channel family protein [Desulfuromonas sp.]|nr:mechanosensitive ion channel family protein [Desulfuromonas sp.]
MDLALLDQTLFDITYRQFALALLAVLVALVGKKLFAYLLTRLLAPLTRRTETDLDDLLLECLRKPLELLVLIIGLFVAVQILQLPEEPTNVRNGAYALLRAMITIAGGWALFNMAGVFGQYLEDLSAKTENDLDDHLVPFVRKSLRVFIVILAGVMVIQNLGYSTSGLLASLGIGGMALAFASKDALSNIFGSLMIIFDRPFKLGDQVIAGNMEGTVEEVGFRSTKIRTPAKTLISVPNSIIANMPLDNVSRMPRRRIKLAIGLTYATTPAQMRTAVARLRALLTTHPEIDPETVQVNFTDFGASSLDITVTCFSVTTVLGEHLNVREDICLKIMDLLEELGLQFAFPSRTVYLHHADSDPPEGSSRCAVS